MPKPEGISRAQYVQWKYMARHPYVNYQADLPGFAQASDDAQQMQMPIGRIAETEGVLFGDRLGERTDCQRPFPDGVIDIILGRQPGQ